MKRSDSQGNRLQETVVPGQAATTSLPVDAQDGQQAAPPLPELPFNVDQFVARELLARGGMSVTFLGHAVGNLADRVVIKVPLSHDPATLERFNDEITVLKELDHPSIVHVRGAGESIIRFGANGHPRKRPWLAMEYISGQSLRQRIKTEQTIRWPEVRVILGDLIKALEYLHSKHLCHRDIKPDNIIFDPQKQRWVLVDFGIAKSLLANPRLTLTLAGQDPGSWDYMSPEQLDGHPVDSRTDIYSLGKTAWEALIGTVPRVGTPLPSVALGDKTVPIEVDTLIPKMVAHRPEDRYQTPGEVAQALQVGALRIEQRKRFKKTARRVLFICTVAAAAILLSAGVWFGGEFLVTQRATATYVENSESPTRTVRLLSLFANSHRFWGRKYVDTKISELGPAAEQERQRMLAEYAEVQADLGNASRGDEFRLSRAQNFLKRYQTIFDDTEQYRSTAQRSSELELAVLTKKENAQVASAVVETKDLEAKGQIKAAMELCDTVLAGLKTADAKKRMQSRRAEVVDTWISAELQAIDATLKSDDPTSLVEAELQLEDIQKTVGATPETTKRQQTYDEALWGYYRAKADAAVKTSSYNEARASVRRYLSESRVRKYVTTAAEWETYITATEDDSDWTTASTSGKQNIRQNAFPLGLKDVLAYQTKWPDGRHKTDAATLAAEVASGHLTYLRSIKDIDTFNDEFKVFREIYPRETEAILSLRRTLCFMAHEAIRRIVGDSSLTPTVKIARLNGLNYKLCEPEKLTYLNKVVNEAVDYVQNPDGWEWYWAYMYWWQRPPADCVTMSSPPTVFVVTITDIEISMSGSYFNKLQGIGDADPRVEVAWGKKYPSPYADLVQLRRIVGPVNCRSFTLNRTNDGKPIAFYFDTAVGDSLGVTIFDSDNSIGDAPAQGISFRTSMFVTSGEGEGKTDGGNTIKLKWKSE